MFIPSLNLYAAGHRREILLLIGYAIFRKKSKRKLRRQKVWAILSKRVGLAQG